MKIQEKKTFTIYSDVLPGFKFDIVAENLDEAKKILIHNLETLINEIKRNG